jgi:hypothetical protein
MYVFLIISIFIYHTLVLIPYILFYLGKCLCVQYMLRKCSNLCMDYVLEYIFNQKQPRQISFFPTLDNPNKEYY